jgi:hypothetical protein
MTTESSAVPAVAWRNRIVGHADVAPGELVPNPRNWRSHPQEQQRALAGALSEVGWVAQVLVNRTTGHVVDGHARIEEALSRGEPEVPVLYVELSAEEEALVLATLDPIGAMAERDRGRLEELLAEVTVEDAGLRALLAALGHALTATSANPSGGEPYLDPDALAAWLSAVPEVETLIVDGGALPGGPPSTLVEWAPGAVRVLRPGSYRL